MTTTRPGAARPDTAGGRGWRVPMVARDIDEEHRASTPLELLFDLTFVVAVAQAAAELAHYVRDDHVGEGVVGYLMVFFAIWWAWMNFTWFASAYDTDDVPYRLLTLLQMSGVLVLAAGVPAAFEDRDFTAVTIGYVVMRVAMIVQWLRAARTDPDHRASALRTVAGVSVVQVGWLLRLLVPHDLTLATFLVLAVAELAVPWWAEHGAMTTWHPQHIAERYGLFTIILLGECVLAATTATQTAVVSGGWSGALLVMGAGSLLLLFGMWWLYFLKDAGRGLARRREMSFRWGYGHFALFAALAAVGAGLEVAAEAVSHEIEASDTLVAGAVGVPVALFLLLVWALHAPLSGLQPRDLATVSAAAVAVLALASLAALGVALPLVVLLLAVPVAALVGLRHTA
jgi:low temperature requirement protein LtrA